MIILIIIIIIIMMMMLAKGKIGKIKETHQIIIIITIIVRR